MKVYKRKITVDNRDNRLLYSDGSTTSYYDRESYNEKINSGITFSGLTGADSHLLVFFEQKTKDLGVYNDILK